MKQDFRMLVAMVKRNNKIYFKDKLSFFLSLITPLILVALFITFLKTVYTDTLLSSIPESVEISSRVVEAFTGGWLFSSILGVSCVTISFCSNMIMVNDRINKNILDFNITPISKSLINISYFISNFISTLIVCVITMIVSVIYLLIVGWYITALDILMILLNVVVYTLFGSLLSTVICNFLNSQGGISAVSTLVSSMYGFLCGAYMPISQFGEAIRAFISFLPGTYGTILFRQYYMRGAIEELGKSLPAPALESIKDSFDGNFYFFGNKVQNYQMFLVLILSSIVIFGTYMLILKYKKNKKERA